MRIEATDEFQGATADAAAHAFGGLDGTEDPDALLAALSLDERIDLLCGDEPAARGNLEMVRRYNGSPVVAGAVPRLGLPGIRFTDGPRGVVMHRSTAFPSSMARGATFDPELEARIGDAIGVEARAQGANLFAGICINLLRHPAWGRAQETYGEDPEVLAAMGVALTDGVQRHVMGCVKHYALNSMENSRFWVDVRVDERDLHDLYLPHFKAVVDAGVASVMSAYNKVEGTFAGHSRLLLRDILKDRWGFEGFVMSDFTFGVRGPRAVEAGMDLEMPHRGWFRRLHRLVASGKVDRSHVDEAAVRLVRTQVRFAGRGEPERYRLDAVASPEHRALAREAATRSIVLLRNRPADDGEPLLPLDLASIERLAVIGRLAARPALGDRGSSQVRPPEVSTILEGLQEVAVGAGVAVVYDDGEDRAEAARVAASCDAAIVVAGTTWRDEGEWIGSAGGDRESLRLPGEQERLLATIAAVNQRTALVLVGGSVLVTDPADSAVAAIAMAWYPGMEGGRAVADVLVGRAEPEGRLPLTWPTSRTELPPFRRFARRIAYGPLFGYRMMEATGQRPAHWFGHGLGYTAFEWGEPRVVGVEEVGEDGRRAVAVEVEVRNVGRRPGSELVQAYVPEVLGSHPAPLRTLRGWAWARAIAPGEEATVRLAVSVPAEAERVELGPSADPDRAVVVAIPTRATG